jgi:hypothetical protein
MWGLLVLIVVAPAAFYSVQAVVHRATSSGSPVPTAVPIITPTAEPRGPAPAVTLAPPLPSPREMDAMAFDSANNDVVMYGGLGFGSGPQTSLRDTWTFDSAGWHLRHPATSPGIDAEWMTEDPVTGDVVLVGGVPPSDHVVETWTWDGVTWTKHSNLPMATKGFVGMAALPARRQLLLVTTPSSAQSVSDDTWTWGGSSWRLAAPATALPIEGSTPILVSDPSHRRLVAVFTGTADSRAETWTWNGATWAQLASNEVAPFDPITASMAADPRTGDVLMYLGGGDVRGGSTWELRGNTWREVDAVSPTIDTDYHGAWLLSDQRIGRVVMIGNAGRPNTLNALWIFTGTRWEAEPPSTLDGQSG